MLPYSIFKSTMLCTDLRLLTWSTYCAVKKEISQFNKIINNYTIKINKKW